jgi:hypothetical protein
MGRVSVESAARLVITAGVGLIGAAAGFHHTHAAAVRAGQHGWLAWADAVVIECMVIVAGLQLVQERRSGGSGRLPLAVLVVAFLIQMGAQVSGAPASFAGWLFAAVPALGCLVVVKFAFRSAPAAASSTGEESAIRAAAAWVDEAEPEPVRGIAAAEESRPEPSPVPTAAVWPPH